MSEAVRFEREPARALVLVFDVGGREVTASVPLKEWLPVTDLEALSAPGADVGAVFDLFRRHLGDEVYESLTVHDLNRVVEMWNEASGAPLGKS